MENNLKMGGEDSDNVSREIQGTKNNLAETGEKKSGKISLWLKIAVVFYAVSIIMAFVIIGKNSKPKTVKTGNFGSLIPSMTKKKGVGLVNISGAIYQRDSSRIWDGSTVKIANKIKRLSEKKNVKAILIDINSPGGTVSAVQDIYSAILRAKKKTRKPFVARIGDVAASGGYYVASACDKIVSNPGSITGSIGVIFRAGNYEGLMKKIGLKYETIKSGKYKDIGSPTRKMTSEERKLLQDMIDDAYDQFVEAVSKGRNMSREELKTLADGRIFTGRQALKVKLVDKLGDFQDALNLAGKMGKLGPNPKIIKSMDPIDEFFSFINIKTSAFDKLESEYLRGPALEYMWRGI